MMQDNEAKADSWKMFDRISPTYDRLNRILSLGQDTRWRRRVAKYLPARAHLEILDLATGTGDQLMAIAKRSPSVHRMVGIDLSEEMMAIARKKFKGTSYENRVEFLHANAEKLPFKTAQFDAATFSFGIRNVPNPTHALSEMFRILKPQGRALILEFSMPQGALRPIVLTYLRSILPKIGAFFSKDAHAYRYLNRTIESFASGKSFCQWMKDAGFKDVKQISMNFGAVSLYIGDKE